MKFTKLTKQMLAISLTLVMLMVPLTAALADDGSGSGDGNWSFPIIVDIDKTVFTLPTDSLFDFVLDPQGIYGMTAAEIEALDVGPDNRLGKITGEGADATWTSLDNAGRIWFTEKYAPIMLNESNFDAVLKVGFTLTQLDGSNVATTTALTAAEPTNVQNGTATSIFIGAVFSTDNVSGTPSSFEGTVASPLLSNSTQTSLFVLESAQYDPRIEASGPDGGAATSTTIYLRDTLEEGTGNGTQFVFYGECNEAADWRNAMYDDVINSTNPDNIIITSTQLVFLGIDILYDIQKVEDGVDYGSSVAAAAGLMDLTHASATSVTYTFATPVSMNFLSDDELAAVGATTAANSAASAASNAANALDTVIIADGDIAAAIVTAEAALDAANNALASATSAIAAASASSLDIDSEAIYDALVAARDALAAAIIVLGDKIAEAEGLLIPTEPGFFGPGVTDRLETTVSATVGTGTTINIPFFFDGKDLNVAMIDFGGGAIFPITEQFEQGDNEIIFTVAAAYVPATYTIWFFLDDYVDGGDFFTLTFISE